MTDKERRFWEAVGFEDTFEGDTGAYYWKAPNGDAGADLPDINSLDDLFRWAVETNEYITEVSFVKGECQIVTRGLNGKGVEFFVGKAKTPAQALYEALYLALEVEG